MTDLPDVELRGSADCHDCRQNFADAEAFVEHVIQEHVDTAALPAARVDGRARP